MSLTAKELKRMGNVSKRRLHSYDEFIQCYKKYKAEKKKLRSEVKPVQIQIP